MSPQDFRTPVFSCNPIYENPTVSSQVNEGPGYWASISNPFVYKGAIQGETQQVLEARIQIAAGVIRATSGMFPRVRHDIQAINTKSTSVSEVVSQI